MSLNLNPFSFFRGPSPDEYLRQEIFEKTTKASTFFSDIEELNQAQNLFDFSDNDFELKDGIAINSDESLSPQQEEPTHVPPLFKMENEAAKNLSSNFIKNSKKKLWHLLPVLKQIINPAEKIFQSINITGIEATPKKRLYTVSIEKENHKKISLTFAVKAKEFHKDESFFAYPEKEGPVFEDERTYKYFPFLNWFTWRFQKIKTVYNIIINDPGNASLALKPVRKFIQTSKNEGFNLIFRDPKSKNTGLHLMADSDSILDGSKSGFNTLRSVFTRMTRTKSAPLILDPKTLARCFVQLKVH